MSLPSIAKSTFLGCTMSVFRHRLRCTVSKILSLAPEHFEEVSGSFNRIWPVLHNDHSENIIASMYRARMVVLILGLFVDIYTRKSRLCAVYQRARQLTMDAVRH